MDSLEADYRYFQDSDILRAALAHTEAVTGFTASLIEKDYYCSLVLRHIFQSSMDLVFKGGTCLSKVHANFNRLSEDLDLILPIPIRTSRTVRKRTIGPFKDVYATIPAMIPEISISEELTGHNDSRQYIGLLAYRSIALNRPDTIKIEVGLREPLIIPAVESIAKTILINPFTSPATQCASAVVNAMSIKEAYAEKVRAALTRKVPAIRDYFDLHYAASNGIIELIKPTFIDIVRDKLNVPGNTMLDMTASREQDLARQLTGQLMPMLRPVDYEQFSLARAVELVREIADLTRSD